MEFEVGAPPKRRGRESKYDWQAFMNAARENEGQWVSFPGPQSLSAHRKNIVEGELADAKPGEFSCRTVGIDQYPDAKTGETVVDEDGNPRKGVRLYIKTPADPVKEKAPATEATATEEVADPFA